MNKNLLFISLAFSGLMSACSSLPQKTFPTAPGTTSNAENLTRETNDPSQEYYPRISPDGKYMLYYAVESSSGFSSGSKKGSIIKKEIGSAVRNPLVADASDATWLPDGTGVVFSYRKPVQPVIVRSNNNGVGLNYISQGAMGGDDSQPNITKDGSKVIFTTQVGSSRMICSMDMKGGSFTVLTDGEHVSINPSDNNKIIYNQKVNGRTQIFTMDLKSGQKTQLTAGDYDCRDGAFSTDGSWIAYTSNQENPASKKYHVYIMRTNGTEVKQLTQGDTDEGDACWSPDGWVFFYSNAGNNYNIWKVKPRM